MKKKFINHFLCVSSKVARNHMCTLKNLTNDFYDTCKLDNKNKSKVIEIDNALYEMEKELKKFHEYTVFVKTTLVGKKSCYKNSLYNMNDYNESNEHFINKEGVRS